MEINLSDRELIQLAKQQEQRAYAVLMERYRIAVYNLIYRIIKNKEDTEDILIESFAKAFDNIEKYDEQFALSTWLFKIASNTAIDYLRKKSIDKIPLEESDGIVDINSINNNIEAILIKNQEYDVLKSYILLLDNNFKEIIALRYFDELSYEEIAQYLNISIPNVKVQLHRAKKQLQRIAQRKERNV